MRHLILPAAVAALACAAGSTQAQVVIQSGYAQPYYGGAAIGSGGLIQAVEGQLLNGAGLGGYAYPGYSGGYGNLGTYGYHPYYGSGYSNYGSYHGSGYGLGYQPYYGSGYSNYGSYYGGNNYRSYGGRGLVFGRRR